MAWKTFVKQEDEIYVKSGKWKCSNSPTGAHHWLIKGREMSCGYCNKVRKLDDKGLVIVNYN